MISGINPIADAPEWGSSYPTTPVGGGFSVVTSIQDPGDPNGSAFNGALALRLHGDLVNVIVDQSPTLTPQLRSLYRPQDR